jgi:hypothetical protein
MTMTFPERVTHSSKKAHVNAATAALEEIIAHALELRGRVSDGPAPSWGDLMMLTRQLTIASYHVGALSENERIADAREAEERGPLADHLAMAGDLLADHLAIGHGFRLSPVTEDMEARAAFHHREEHA